MSDHEYLTNEEPIIPDPPKPPSPLMRPWSVNCEIPYSYMRQILEQLLKWYQEERKLRTKGVKGKFRSFPTFSGWVALRVREYKEYRQQELSEMQNDLNNAFRE